jgi:DNA modification methylase
MDVIDQLTTDEFAIYNADSCEVLPSIPDESVHLAIYSPPFAIEGGGCLYHYSSTPRDLSNCRSYAEFFDHYAFIAEQIYRVLLPGRIAAVHCTDVPNDGANLCTYTDFPGDLIRLHEKIGFGMLPRITIWKEPLEVRNRTMTKALAHKTVVEDSTLSSCAASDYLLIFRKDGDNPVPVSHPTGFHKYVGERTVPTELHRYRGWKGKQTENRFSHWIWRQYASSVWMDIRLHRVLPYREAREHEDEKHPHPLQLDVIERATELYTNPGEAVLTPFMGVGSEVYGAIQNGRRAIGIELKSSYYRQAVKNLTEYREPAEGGNGSPTLFDSSPMEASA